MPRLNPVTNKEKFAWIRLARELKVLRILTMEILCDTEYQKLLGATRMDGLRRAEKGINRVKSEAEEKQYSRIRIAEGPDLFYGDGIDSTQKIVREIRDKLKQIAKDEAVNLYGLKEQEV